MGMRQRRLAWANGSGVCEDGWGAIYEKGRSSLDRKNSALGFVAGNLQVVTRAANYFKSAINDEDWLSKAEAMEKMAIAVQQRRISKK